MHIKKIKLQSKIQAGYKAKKIGEQFETIIKISLKKLGVAVIQIPSGCRWITPFKAISVKTPFDFCAFYKGKSICFDTKTVNKETFSKSEIKNHQIDELLNIEKQAIIAGYIIWFRPINKIVFYKASSLYNLKPRQSLKPDDGIFIGSIENIFFYKLL